ncbi:TipAS antibiotic-recognition domain-containing protein [Streptomyces sp. NBC_00846]|nr:TipAS antibiotic-recognition domain-containing protein [Streptomyces sp. NBC_00846]
MVGQRRPQRSPQRLAPVPDGPRAHPGCREGSRQARAARQARYRKVSRNLPASAGRALQECTPEIHRGLGEMYVSDPRFRAYYESMRPGLAEHLRAAIDANAERLS